MRKIDGYLPTAEVAFVDEIFKANSAILNALLTLLNERLFDNGNQRFGVPLMCLVRLLLLQWQCHIMKCKRTAKPGPVLNASELKLVPASAPAHAGAVVGLDSRQSTHKRAAAVRLCARVLQVCKALDHALLHAGGSLQRAA